MNSVGQVYFGIMLEDSLVERLSDFGFSPRELTDFGIGKNYYSGYSQNIVVFGIKVGSIDGYGSIEIDYLNEMFGDENNQLELRATYSEHLLPGYLEAIDDIRIDFISNDDKELVQELYDYVKNAEPKKIIAWHTN